ncbi:MAG: HAD-IA family hydrolase [Pseudomonadota bacterium]
MAGVDMPPDKPSDAPYELLERCETLMLDMDGTILDLAYDNYMWLTRVPEAYAETHAVSPEVARKRLFALFEQMRGTLDWYCLEHWSERLKLDVVALHHDHRERIEFLPGARRFLERIVDHEVRVLLVTNSHRSTLDLKSDELGLDVYFDRIYSSHDMGHPKEAQRFWQNMQAEDGFDPQTTLFVDDTVPVLRSADAFGIAHLVQVMRPDTSRPSKSDAAYTGVESVAELVDGGD